MNRKDILDALAAVDALATKQKYHKAETYFPDTGKLSRDKYPEQMRLMKAGKKHKLRALVGGNGSGKSLWNALETYFHASGKYPAWWDGHRFTKPIRAWMCSITGEQIRDGIQAHMLGGIGDEEIGSGIIAREDLLDDKGKIMAWSKAGIANCIATIQIRHYTRGVFDGYSTIDFKPYSQGWAAFQGATVDWISFDEEPEDPKVTAEAMARLRPKDGGAMGHFLATFTPTHGYTSTFESFVPNDLQDDGTHPDNPLKFTAIVKWSLTDDSLCPHLTDEYKHAMFNEWKQTDPLNVEARMTGMAAIGSGLVYPINPSFVIVPKQQIMPFWPKVYGMDPGQANFAVVWVTKDPNTGVYYVYDEYKNGHVAYVLHAEAIKARGQWIHGGIDPHEAVKPRDTGETVENYFETQGLHLTAAKGDANALRARIRTMFESGALKIMNNCGQIIKAIRTYRYDTKDFNKIARGQDDHVLDALMYAIAVFDQVAMSYSEFEEEELGGSKRVYSGNPNKNSITGY